jgi:pectate lyase
MALLHVVVGGMVAALFGCNSGLAHPFRMIHADAGRDAGANEGSAGGGGDGGPGQPDSGPDFGLPTSCPVKLVGYATLDGGTSGGGDAAAMVVTTGDQLKAAAALVGPGVIRIGGTLTLTAPIEVASDKTVVGLSPGDGLVGNGLFIKKVRNVIVRNLKIALVPKPDDAITIQESLNIWVDHCDLSSELVSPRQTYDGLIDINHASDNVTVSWNRFHDHYDTSLVGHSADNGAEDTGHLTVTYHHNSFRNTPSGSPRARFGHVHLYNNYYLYLVDEARVPSSYGIASSMSATLRIERNVFDGVISPIITLSGDDPVAGTVADSSNSYIPLTSAMTNIITTPMNNWAPPYPYATDSTESLPALINACAGVGKVP